MLLSLENSTELGPAGLATWSLGLLIGGAVLGLVLLRLLQRRFKIFTRGTLAFMISALMIFTVIDGLDHLSDIRINEGRLREDARRASVSSLVQAYFNSGPELAAEQVPSGGYQAVVTESLKAVDARLGADLRDAGSPVGSPRELKLVSLDVGRHLIGTIRRFNPSHYQGDDWGFSALLDDGANFVTVQGYVRIADGRIDSVEFLDISAKMGKIYDHKDRRALDLFQRASSFRSADYSLGLKDGATLLVRAEDR